MNVRWMTGNNHVLPDVVLPADPTRSVKKFFTDMHLPMVVAGMPHAPGMAFYGGGGDHGGPITKKIQLPKSWKELNQKYKSVPPPIF
jgi:hypothetical protein